MSGYGENSIKESYARDGGMMAQGQMLGRPGMASDTARQPETVRFLGELEKMLAICLGSIETLETRLERVVRQQPEGIRGSEASAPREVAATPMGSGIQMLLDRATTINSRLMQLSGRIEV